jgi:hypothetical protein
MTSNIIFGYLEILVRILDVPNSNFSPFLVVTFSSASKAPIQFLATLISSVKPFLIHKSYLCRRWLNSTIDKTLLYSFFWVIQRCLNFMCRRSEHAVCSVCKGHVNKKNSSSLYNLLRWNVVFRNVGT